MQEMGTLVKAVAVGSTCSDRFLFVLTAPFYNMTPEERIDADNRSIYVGNVSTIH